MVSNVLLKEFQNRYFIARLQRCVGGGKMARAGAGGGWRLYVQPRNNSNNTGRSMTRGGFMLPLNDKGWFYVAAQ